MGSIISNNPLLAVVITLVVILVIATLTLASAISGALTAAAVSMAGLIVLVGLVWVFKKV